MKRQVGNWVKSDVRTRMDFRPSLEGIVYGHIFKVALMSDKF